jgi:hypothetical protein
MCAAVCGIVLRWNAVLYKVLIERDADTDFSDVLEANGVGVSRVPIRDSVWIEAVRL